MHGRERALRRNLTDETCKKNNNKAEATKRGDEAAVAKHPPNREDYSGKGSARTRTTSSTTTKHLLEITRQSIRKSGATSAAKYPPKQQ
jgi:hypothetical protein